MDMLVLSCFSCSRNRNKFTPCLSGVEARGSLGPWLLVTECLFPMLSLYKFKKFKSVGLSPNHFLDRSQNRTSNIDPRPYTLALASFHVPKLASKQWNHSKHDLRSDLALPMPSKSCPTRKSKFAGLVWAEKPWVFLKLGDPWNPCFSSPKKKWHGIDFWQELVRHEMCPKITWNSTIWNTLQRKKQAKWRLIAGEITEPWLEDFFQPYPWSPEGKLYQLPPENSTGCYGKLSIWFDDLPIKNNSIFF